LHDAGEIDKGQLGQVARVELQDDRLDGDLMGRRHKLIRESLDSLLHLRRRTARTTARR